MHDEAVRSQPTNCGRRPAQSVPNEADHIFFQCSDRNSPGSTRFLHAELSVAPLCPAVCGVVVSCVSDVSGAANHRSEPNPREASHCAIPYLRTDVAGRIHANGVSYDDTCDYSLGPKPASNITAGDDVYIQESDSQSGCRYATHVAIIPSCERGKCCRRGLRCNNH